MITWLLDGNVLATLDEPLAALWPDVAVLVPV